MDTVAAWLRARRSRYAANVCGSRRTTLSRRRSRNPWVRDAHRRCASGSRSVPDLPGERAARAALHLALEHEGAGRAGVLEEEPLRRGHRSEILTRTARPPRERLAPARCERLLKAPSLFYGIEIDVVLKDIWGASDREVESLGRWMLEALLAAALADADDDRRAARPVRPPAPPMTARSRRRVTSRA